MYDAQACQRYVEAFAGGSVADQANALIDLADQSTVSEMPCIGHSHYVAVFRLGTSVMICQWGGHDDRDDSVSAGLAGTVAEAEAFYAEAAEGVLGIAARHVDRVADHERPALLDAIEAMLG